MSQKCLAFPSVYYDFSARHSLCTDYLGTPSSSIVKRRPSSMSLRVAPRTNGDICEDQAGNLLLPFDRSPSRISDLFAYHRSPSRMSTASAWSSLRSSFQNLSKAAMHVFTVAPCSQHRCCIGCVSLRDAVPLICLVELVFIGLCSLIAVDFYITDGRLFYTKDLEGKGVTIAVAFSVFLAVSLPVIAFTLAVWHYRKPYLYVIHVLWQWTVLELLLYFTYSILKRAFSAEVRQRTGFLLPSAVVLSVASLIAVLIQCWWLFVFVDAMFFEKKSRRRKKSSSNDYGDSKYDSFESRRTSHPIPVVKVDRTTSPEMSPPAEELAITLTEADETPEVVDDGNV
ncbi:unnamed protein product [Cylicocyclus nassatus]|uniref:Uncharacterized protein n=1 Tax=Cylicocyclus nassatus TaxID=53992 RepID=A0AA36M8Q6_CYLNA|nr:unnamed protein product [Cylicocyclus nassatus]